MRAYHSLAMVAVVRVVIATPALRSAVFRGESGVKKSPPEAREAREACGSGFQMSRQTGATLVVFSSLKDSCPSQGCLRCQIFYARYWYCRAVTRLVSSCKHEKLILYRRRLRVLTLCTVPCFPEICERNTTTVLLLFLCSNFCVSLTSHSSPLLVSTSFTTSAAKRGVSKLPSNLLTPSI